MLSFIEWLYALCVSLLRAMWFADSFCFVLFFVMKAISVCSNIELSLGKKKYSVFIGPDTGGNLDNQNEGI